MSKISDICDSLVKKIRHQNYDKNNFVGREKEIKDTILFFKSHFNDISNTNIPVIVYHGEGGIGKTFLCNKISKVLNNNKIISLGIIDLKETNNCSILSAIKYISGNITDNGFKIVAEQIKNYEHTKDIDKLKFAKQIETFFFEAIKNYSITNPLVIIVDNLQSIKNSSFWQSFVLFMKNCKGKCGFILAGHEDISLGNSSIEKKSFKIIPFLANELKEYAESRQKQSNINIKEINNNAINMILSLTDGRPVICALTFDWITENPQQIGYITTLPKPIFEQELIKLLNGLKQAEVDILKIMPYINRRMTPEIIQSITGKEMTDCCNLIEKLSRFSFIKFQESEKGITLHDEIQNLIKQVFPISNDTTLSLYKKVLNFYDKSLNNNREYSMITEKLYYLLRYNTRSALCFLEQEFQYALDIYDYDFCVLLIDEANRDNNTIANTIRLLKSKLLICQYKPVDAMRILEEIQKEIVQSDDEIFYASILECMGECIINPCTMENADLFKAVELFKASYKVFERNNLKSRMPYCLFGLGKAHIFIGQHAEADKAFSKAATYAKNSNNYGLMVKILDETGKMLRLQQEVDKSLKKLNESFKIREQQNLTENRGVFYYYLANTHRDLNDFITADENYKKAETMLQEVDNKFSLCELYCDKSWFEYLRDETNEFTLSKEYLSKAEDIAQKYGFGIEFSEYAHIRYEIAMLQEDYVSAYENLDEALKNAYKYSNIYMILDCLNHDAQRAFRFDDFKRMREILTDMIKYEELGCGIKVFRGRALLTNGDFFYKAKDYTSTYNNWVDGFCIVALYGNSRSNVDLFEDLFSQRKEQFKEILTLLGETYKKQFKRTWNQKRISPEFDYVLQICE